MIKSISILALFALLSFAACSPEDFPMPVQSPLAAQADTDVALSPAPEYAGEEGVERQTRCRYVGTVLDYRGEGNCSIVIQLRDGSRIAPIHIEKLPVKFQEGMRVMLDFKYLREMPQNACRLAEPAEIICITPLKGLEAASDGTRIDG